MVEINKNLLKADDTIRTSYGTLMITPPINESFWLYRVQLKHGQAIVAFPKFGILGCGFVLEEDWNTNLPLQMPAEQIYNHIKCNKKYKDISKAECLAAIRAIQAVVAKTDQMIRR